MYNLSSYNDWIKAIKEQKKVLEAMSVNVAIGAFGVITITVHYLKSSFTVRKDDKGNAIKEGDNHAMIYIQRNLYQAGEQQIYVR